MTSIIAAAQAPTIPIHGKHHHRAAAPNPQVEPQTATATTGSAATTASASPGAGLQRFASELQSILLSAQSVQSNSDASSAATAAATGDPAVAADPTNDPGQAGPIRHLADRLQALLGADPSTAAKTDPATNTAPNGLESVLNTLQNTLQRTLASYGAHTPGAVTKTLTA